MLVIRLQPLLVYQEETFSSTVGLSITAGSGVIDVSASTPGTYTVTYTTNGTCPQIAVA